MTGGTLKGLLTVLVAVVTLGVFGAGVAQAGIAHIKVSDTLAGSVVTDGRGYVLFVFRREEHGIAFCLRTETCMTDWPLVETTGRPVAGPGINPRLLSSIPYKGRLRVVTYAGWPLHTYKFAYSVQTSVIDIGIEQYGGPWYALDPAGRFIK